MIYAIIAAVLVLGVVCIKTGKTPTACIAIACVHVQAFSRWLCVEAAPGIKDRWGRYGESVEYVKRSI